MRDEKQRKPLPEHGVYTVFVELPPDTKLEFLLPLGDKRPIQDFLNKNKNIEKALKSVKPLGIRPLDEKSKIGAHNKPVVFLHPKDCGRVLVELEQE
ncbi:unnamed protein product, partial [Mesorhabditis belari]|uniref:Uncharacterized protein n=1 Tax=Mesorhabditis belari TaxID=2138241 RepID=A0AAF3F8C7_9BILA